MTDELLTTTQVAEAFDVWRQTVADWIHKGYLPAQRIGRDYVVRASDLAAFTRPKAGRKPRRESPAG